MASMTKSNGCSNNSVKLSSLTKSSIVVTRHSGLIWQHCLNQSRLNDQCLYVPTPQQPTSPRHPRQPRKHGREQTVVRQFRRINERCRQSGDWKCWGNLACKFCGKSKLNEKTPPNGEVVLYCKQRLNHNLINLQKRGFADLGGRSFTIRRMNYVQAFDCGG